MRVKGTDILKFLLLTVGLTGLILVAVTAPGLFSAIGPFHKKRFKQFQVKRSFEYAKKNKLITIKETASGHVVMLTDEGKKKLQAFRLGEIRLKKSKQWDGKWRIVVFDVPEKYKLNRFTFSKKLKELGLVQMQKSVWVWPYELGDEVDLMKEVYEIRPFVRIITAVNIDRQSDLLKFFKLRT